MTTAKGVPAELVGIGSQTTVFGVSGPLVTSYGTTSGSAVVWVIDGAPFRPTTRFRSIGANTPRAWFVGNTNPFNPPGIGDDRVYVGNQAGMLYGFGGKVHRRPAATRLRLPQLAKANPIGPSDGTPITRIAHAVGEVCDSEGVQVLRDFSLYDLFILSFVQLVLSTMLVLCPAREMGTRLRWTGSKITEVLLGRSSRRSLAAFSCFVTAELWGVAAGGSRLPPICSPFSR